MGKKKWNQLIILNLLIGCGFLGVHKLGFEFVGTIDVRAFTLLFCGVAIFFNGFLRRIYYKENIENESELAEINSGIMIGCWFGGACIILAAFVGMFAS